MPSALAMACWPRLEALPGRCGHLQRRRCSHLLAPSVAGHRAIRSAHGAPMASASRSTPAPGPRNHGRHGWRLAPAGAAPHGLHRCLQRPWLSRRWQPGLLWARATGSADGPHSRRWQASRRRAPWALRMALRPAMEGGNRWEHRRRCGWPRRPGRASSQASKPSPTRIALRAILKMLYR